MSSSNTMALIEKLTGRENYATWRFAVQTYLEHEELWCCVTAKTNEEMDSKLDTKAKSKIILLVHPINYVHIQEAKTAKEVWNNLAKAFDDKGLTRRVGLLRDLINTTLENCQNIEDYVNKIMTTAHKLRNIGFEVNDEWLGTLLLAGLPEMYQPMIMALESSGVTITADSVKTKLLQDVRNSESSALYTKSKGNQFVKQAQDKNKTGKGPRCYVCNKYGHISKNCRNKKKEQKSNDNTDSGYVAVFSATINNDNNNWYIDSGASMHMTMNRDLLYDEIIPPISTIRAANDKKLAVKACGKINLKVVNMQGQMETIKVPTDIRTKSKRVHSLNITHNPHMDIPPFVIYYQDYITENIIDEVETTNPLHEIQDDEIPIKRIKIIDILNKESNSNNESSSKEESISNNESSSNKESSSNNELSLNKGSSSTNELSSKKESSSNTITISNKEQETIENEFEIKKKNKKEFDFNELKFEVEYLNLEEQLREFELKKLKYKDFTFQCEECGLGFLTGEVFEDHKARHTELAGPHKCSICALHFKSPDVLSQHTLGHKRRFKCLLCNCQIPRWSSCVAHRYQCGGVVDPRACGDCGKVFSNEYSLKVHMKVHKSEKKYYCEQCDRRFVGKQRWTVHMRSHSGIKPFSCTQCARNFTTRSNLRAHDSVHDNSPKFYCVECHTYYKSAKSLKRHFNESAKHVGLECSIYSCKECTKQFSTEKSLNYHISTRHGTEYRCTQCDKIFMQGMYQTVFYREVAKLSYKYQTWYGIPLYAMR